MADADWDSPMKSARSHGPDTVRRLAGCPPGTCWSWAPAPPGSPPPPAPR